MATHRIFYIDALKAFAIVLVVMGHLSPYIWETGDSHSLYLPILSAFHMPLFMAMSGYVTNVEKFQLEKKAKMLIPFFVFGLAWVAYNHYSFLAFFEHEAKGGYWFLYVLFMFYLFMTGIRASKRNLYVGMVFVQVFLMGLHFCLHRTVPGTTLSTDHMFQLWPFFCMGIVMRKRLQEKLLQHKLLSTAGCSLVIACVIGGGKLMHLTGTLEIYSNDLMSFFIVPLLFLIFHEAEYRTKAKHNKLKAVTKYLVNELGVNTLQIYVLQYFALSFFIKYLYETMNWNLTSYEWIASPIISIILCYLCVLVSQAMHKMKLGFVFGR